MRDRRYNFRGHRIKPKLREEKTKRESDIEEESEDRDHSLLLLIGMAIGMFFLLFLFFLIFGNMFDNVTIEGTYTVRIYVPTCDTGRLVYVQHNVSGQYLFDNDLGKRKYMSGDELEPVSNYLRWEEYVYENTGEYIPNNTCCVKFIKE